MNFSRIILAAVVALSSQIAVPVGAQTQRGKASFYSNYFSIIKNDLPKSFSGVSANSLFDFIYKELYQVVDHSKHDSNNLLYQCYLSVRNYISTHNEQNHICKSIKFGSNLNNALSVNPNLFYFNPL